MTVKLWYRLGDRELVKQVVLNPARGQASDRIEFMLPADYWAYDYQIDWRLTGNRTVTTGAAPRRTRSCSSTKSRRPDE